MDAYVPMRARLHHCSCYIIFLAAPLGMLAEQTAVMYLNARCVSGVYVTRRAYSDWYIRLLAAVQV